MMLDALKLDLDSDEIDRSLVKHSVLSTDAEQTLDLLHDMTVSLEQLIEDNLVDHTSLEGYVIALNAIGVEDYSQEGLQLSFNSPATDTAKEIFRAIRRFFEAIWRYVKRAYDFVSDTIQRMMTNTTKFRERLNGLRKELDSMKRSNLNPGRDVEIVALKRMHISGRTNPADILRGLRGIKRVNDDLVAKYPAKVSEYYRTVVDSMMKGASGKEYVNLDDELNETRSPWNKDYRSMELPGSFVLKYMIETSTANRVTYLGRLNVDNAYPGKKTTINYRVDSPSLVDLSNILDMLFSVTDGIDDLKQMIERINNERLKALNAGERFIKAAENERLHETWKSSGIQRNLRALNRDHINGLMNVLTYYFRCVRATATYIDKCLASFI